MRSGQVLSRWLAVIQRIHLPPRTSLWIAAALALTLIVLFWMARRRYRRLPEIPAASDPDAIPDCMVVIPARNEEKTIGDAVRSLPPDTVIVIDDDSEDRTGEMARKAGAGVLPAPPLPRNGIGKPNACAAGARVLTSRWILFADADTRFENGFLPAVVAFAESSGLTMLSVHLQPECKSLAEFLMLPYARALFFCAPTPEGRPKSLFAGQCVLVRREPYMFMGTHGAVVTQLVDDIRLSMIAERHRLKVAVARADTLGHIRLYHGLDGMRAGLERHAFRYMVLSSWAGISVFVTVLLTSLWLPVLAWLTFGGLGVGRHGITAAFFAFLPFVLLAPWYQEWPWALLAPVALYRILPMLARGLFSALLGRPIQWKGRRVRAVS